MARIITEDNWFEATMNALEELENEWTIELQHNPELERRKEIEGKLEEVKDLIHFLAFRM